MFTKLFLTIILSLSYEAAILTAREQKNHDAFSKDKHQKI